MKTHAIIVMCFILAKTSLAEVPLMSSKQLEDSATHIVVGKLEQIFSKTTESKDWRRSESVAAIRVTVVEKGKRIQTGDVIYGHFWNAKWIGEGNPPPSSSGHHIPPEKSEVRAYLQRIEGRYKVLLPNGIIKLDSKKPK